MTLTRQAVLFHETLWQLWGTLNRELLTGPRKISFLQEVYFLKGLHCEVLMGQAARKSP